MNDLVFLEPNKLGSVPFTTSKVIAEMTGIEHRKLKDAIRKHQADIEVFGILARYEPIIQDRGRGQPEVVYKLNEEQATLLMTLLKNTPTVVEFKVELVRQFYAMRKELTARAVARAGRIPPRRDMTDAIRTVCRTAHTRHGGINSIPTLRIRPHLAGTPYSSGRSGTRPKGPIWRST